MEAAVRHAALRDPTAPASPWTMQKPWMCAVPRACLQRCYDEISLAGTQRHAYQPHGQER